MESDKACPEEFSDAQREYDSEVRTLRDSIESLLGEVQVGLCERSDYMAEPEIKKYRKKREEMMQWGLTKEDIDYYDSRFKAMPWHLLGMKEPEL